MSEHKTESAQPKFAVGDAVVVTSVNRGRGYNGTVTKVGRKLVTVANQWNQEDVFRIDTGSKNDAYQHERVWTLAEHAARERRSNAFRRLGEHRLRFDMGMSNDVPTETVEALADLMDELRTPPGQGGGA